MIDQIIQRAISDESFAHELRAAAVAAGGKKLGSPEMDKLLDYFKSSPQQLQGMSGSATIAGVTTVTTTTTYTTAACTTTGTTTTTTGQ